MRRGAIVSGVVAILAAAGLTAVFVRNASPYTTIAEVEKYNQDGVHVVGKLVPNTLKHHPLQRQLTFDLKDETGLMNVVYQGAPVSNLQTATQVVVIGQYRDGKFQARDMLVKCPSKYESEKSSAGAKSSGV